MNYSIIDKATGAVIEKKVSKADKATILKWASENPQITVRFDEPQVGLSPEEASADFEREAAAAPSPYIGKQYSRIESFMGGLLNGITLKNMDDIVGIVSPEKGEEMRTTSAEKKAQHSTSYGAGEFVGEAATTAGMEALAALGLKSPMGGAALGGAASGALATLGEAEPGQTSVPQILGGAAGGALGGAAGQALLGPLLRKGGSSLVKRFVEGPIGSREVREAAAQSAKQELGAAEAEMLKQQARGRVNVETAKTALSARDQELADQATSRIVKQVMKQSKSVAEAKKVYEELVLDANLPRNIRDYLLNYRDVLLGTGIGGAAGTEAGQFVSPTGGTVTFGSPKVSPPSPAVKKGQI